MARIHVRSKYFNCILIMHHTTKRLHILHKPSSKNILIILMGVTKDTVTKDTVTMDPDM